MASAGQGRGDVVREVDVQEVSPAPFLLARRIGVAAAILAMFGAVIPLAPALSTRPMRATWVVVVLAAALLKLAFPAPKKHERRARVRVSKTGVTCDGEPLIAVTDIARATAVPRGLLLERRARGEHVTLAPSDPKDVDAMLEALGFSARAWTTRVVRRPEMDAFSLFWRLGQVALILASIPFAPMESLQGWGFVVVLIAAVIAFLWGREMRFVELAIDAKTLRLTGLGTDRVIAIERIAAVEPHHDRVNVTLEGGTSIPLISADADPASREALAARVLGLLPDEDDEDEDDDDVEDA